MKKATLFLLLAVLCAGEAFSQKLTWDRMYTRKGDLIVPKVALSLPGGGWLMAGYDANPGNSVAVFYDKAGNLVADTLYQDEGEFADAAVGPDGNAYLAGAMYYHTDLLSHVTAVLAKYSPQGKLLGRWTIDSVGMRRVVRFSQLQWVSGKLFLLSGSNRLMEFDTANGTFITHYKHAGETVNSFTHHDGHFYLSVKDSLLKLDGAFNPVWEKSVGLYAFQLLPWQGDRLVGVNSNYTIVADTTGSLLKRKDFSFPSIYQTFRAMVSGGNLLFTEKNAGTGSDLILLDTSLTVMRRIAMPEGFRPFVAAEMDTLLGVVGAQPIGKYHAQEALLVFPSAGQPSATPYQAAIMSVRVSNVKSTPVASGVPVYNVTADYELVIKNTGALPIDTLSLSAYQGSGFMPAAYTRIRKTALGLQPGDTIALHFTALMHYGVPSTTLNYEFALYGPNDHMNGDSRGGYSGSLTFTGLTEQTAASEAGLHIFPNPATNRLTISGDFHSPCTLRLYDLTGRLILVKTGVNNGMEISVEGLPKGLYNARLEAGGHLIHEAKIIKY